MIAFGLVAGAVGFLLLPTLLSAAGLLIAMTLLGVAAAADAVAPGAVMGDVVSGRGGTVVAAFQMAGDLGAVLGPIVAGWIADTSGYGASFAVAAAVCLAPLAAVAAAPETLVRTERVAPQPA